MSLARSPEDIEKDIANIEHALLTVNISLEPAYNPYSNQLYFQGF